MKRFHSGDNTNDPNTHTLSQIDIAIGLLRLFTRHQCENKRPRPSDLSQNVVRVVTFAFVLLHRTHKHKVNTQNIIQIF